MNNNENILVCLSNNNKYKSNKSGNQNNVCLVDLKVLSKYPVKFCLVFIPTTGE